MDNEILTEEQAQELFNKVISGEPIDNGTNSEKPESKEQIEETTPVATSTGEAIQADSQPVQTQPETKEGLQMKELKAVIRRTPMGIETRISVYPDGTGFIRRTPMGIET